MHDVSLSQPARQMFRRTGQLKVQTPWNQICPTKRTNRLRWRCPLRWQRVSQRFLESLELCFSSAVRAGVLLFEARRVTLHQPGQW